MNVELLQKVKEHVLEEPSRFQMGDVIHRANPGESYCDLGIEITVPKCGTVACIAGWSLVLSGERSTDMGKAEELLGISDVEGDRLFLMGRWPNEFESRFSSADNPQERANIAAERIDHFIATNGAE